MDKLKFSQKYRTLLKNCNKTACKQPTERVRKSYSLLISHNIIIKFKKKKLLFCLLGELPTTVKQHIAYSPKKTSILSSFSEMTKSPSQQNQKYELATGIHAKLHQQTCQNRGPIFVPLLLRSVTSSPAVTTSTNKQPDLRNHNISISVIFTNFMPHYQNTPKPNCLNLLSFLAAEKPSVIRQP